MRYFWIGLFAAVPLVAGVLCWLAPAYGLWFPTAAKSPLGQEIDNLFYLILTIVTIVFFATNFALVYAMWKYSAPEATRGWFSHGSHALEVLWTITPAGVLLFISLYQMDVWARFRFQKTYDQGAQLAPLAEVTARQFEWRIRYPHPTRKFKTQQEVQNWLKHRQPDDLYAVNDLHLPSQSPVVIHLTTEDVLHSFFIPDLRVKQDAVPGKQIPIEFEASESGHYELVCAELCGWGHYKMKGRVVAETDHEFAAYLQNLERRQFDDGVASRAAASPSAEE